MLCAYTKYEGKKMGTHVAVQCLKAECFIKIYTFCKSHHKNIQFNHLFLFCVCESYKCILISASQGGLYHITTA